MDPELQMLVVGLLTTRIRCSPRSMMDAWEGPLLSPFADASSVGVSWDLDNWEGMTGTVLVLGAVFFSGPISNNQFRI